MFVLILGGGKIGTNLTRILLAQGHEVVLVESHESHYERLEAEFEHVAILGDATELYVLEQAGIERPPDLVIAVTGDDEDNIMICQLARDTYGCLRVIARCNDPRNQQYFDLLGVAPTVSATQAILALIEHEVPEHRMVHLLELKRDDVEVVEILVEAGSEADGCSIGELGLPEDVLIGAVFHRAGQTKIASAETELHAGDQVLAILIAGEEDVLQHKFRA